MGRQNASVDLSLVDDSGCDEDVDVEHEGSVEEPNEEGLGEDEQNEGEFYEERSGEGLNRDACEEKQDGVYEESNEEEVYEEPNEEEVYEDEPNEESYEEDQDEEVNCEGEPTEEAIYGEESIEEEIYKEETEDDSSEASAAQSSFENNKDEEDCHLKFTPVSSGKHVTSADALGDHLQKSPIEGNTSGEYDLSTIIVPLDQPHSTRSPPSEAADHFLVRAPMAASPLPGEDLKRRFSQIKRAIRRVSHFIETKREDKTSDKSRHEEAEPYPTTI